MTIKAIETKYNGYNFRSRLEARWAVFFDVAGIRYEYENGNVHRFKYPECAGWRTDDKGYSWNNSKLKKAYDKARQARFEHGETPVVGHD